MIRPGRLALAAAVAFAPTTISAQQGTITYSLRGSVPDSISAMGGGIKEVDLQITAAFETGRSSFTLGVGPGMDWVGGIDLSQARVIGLYRENSDTMTVAVVLPPELAVMMGGAPGVRIDIPVSGISDASQFNTDSLLREEQNTRYENTGRTDQVAGRRCEIWHVTSPTADGPLVMCLAEAPALARRMYEFGSKASPFGSAMSEFQEVSRQRFGGRDMLVVRMEFTDGVDSFLIELVDLTEGKPDPGFFQIPEELQVIDMDLIQGLIQMQTSGS